MKYIERFELKEGKTNFSLAISEEPKSSIFSGGKDGFYPWSGGCGIGGNQKTVADAREICFNHVVSDIDGRIAGFEARIKELKSLRESLGNDVFNLGLFRVKA